MIDPRLSPDTQATALLVGRFGKGQAKPLTRADFNKIAQSLHQRGLRPSDLFRQVPSDLPIEEGRISGLIGRGTALALAIEEWNQVGIKVVSRGDSDYPDRFKKQLKGGAAPILYYAGALDLLARATISVVGSRDATDAGLEFAGAIGKRAASEDLVIVSGDARGVDRAAMDAALDAGGSVVGVLADSLSKSVLSKRYRRAVADGRLLLLSHVEPDARFTVGQAMERNRYLYAAADAVIVADSDIKGGTWNGAIENLKHGWAPAYVRQGAEVRSGNVALLGEGLIRLDESWLSRGQSLRALFDGKMTARDVLPLFEPALAAAEPEIGNADGATLHALFLDRLKAWLKLAPQTNDAIALHFSIEPVQAERWLLRAAKAGIIRCDDGTWTISSAVPAPERNIA